MQNKKYLYTTRGKVNWHNHFGKVYALVVYFKVEYLNIFWPNIYTPKYMLNRNIYNIY